MADDTETAQTDTDSYADTSPFTRLLTRPGAPVILARVGSREALTPDEAASQANVAEEEAREVLDILVDAGAATEDGGVYSVAGEEHLGAALLRAVKTLPEETGVKFDELLASEADVRAMDVFLRRYYHGVTIPMLAKAAGITEGDAHEAQTHIEATGVLTTPEDGAHPGEADMIKDEVAEPGEPAFVIDTDSEAVSALGGLHKHLVFESQSIPPEEA